MRTWKGAKGNDAGREARYVRIAGLMCAPISGNRDSISKARACALPKLSFFLSKS